MKCCVSMIHHQRTQLLAFLQAEWYVCALKVSSSLLVVTHMHTSLMAILLVSPCPQWWCRIFLQMNACYLEWESLSGLCPLTDFLKEKTLLSLCQLSDASTHGSLKKTGCWPSCIRKVPYILQGSVAMRLFKLWWGSSLETVRNLLLSLFWKLVGIWQS